MMKLLAPNGKPSNLNEVQYRLVRTPEFKAWFGDWENSPETASKVVDENGEPLVVWHNSNSDKVNVFESKFGYNFFATDVDTTYRYGGKRLYSCFINARKIFDVNKLSVTERNDIKLILKDKSIMDTFIRFLEENGYREWDEDLSVIEAYKEYHLKNNLKFENLDISDYELLVKVFFEGDNWFLIESSAIQNYIKKNKYNAFKTVEYHLDIFSHQRMEYNIAVYDSNNIKLADGTNTTFDSNNPDIRYKNGGDIEEPTEFWGESAAGVLLICNKTNRVLLFHRSEDVYEPETWGIISGKIDYDENPKDAVLRELVEETKFSEKEVKSIVLKPSYVYKKGSFTFYNYLGFVDSEFTPILNWENTDYKWCDIGDYPQPLHFGVSLLLKNIDLKKELYKKTIKKRLLAPNGKPTNLTAEQYNLVRTPAFKKWFGDWELLYQYKDRYTYEGHDRLFNKPKIGNEYDLVDGTKAKLLSLDKEKGQYEVLIYGKKQFISFSRMLYLYSGIPDVFTEERLNEISKVVDENGEPLVVYHGSRVEFNVFNGRESWKANYKEEVGTSYFTPDKDMASGYGGNSYIYAIFLNFKNPLIYDAEGISYIGANYNALSKSRNNNNDSVIIRNVDDTSAGREGRLIDTYISFNPNQIKIADGTNTTFDSNNPDIRYAEGGSIPDLLSSQEVEDKLGRKLDWWNDDIVYLSGIKYKKVYLRPEYKKV